MKKEILALASALLLLGGCAQKGLHSGTENGAEEAITIKAAIEAAAKEEGWNIVPLGDRKFIVDRYFSETKNVAAEISLKREGYTIEYSSGQNISESEAEDLLEDLKEAIDKKLKAAPSAE